MAPTDDDHDEAEEEPDASDPDAPRPRRRAALDGRTLAICALVALVAALVAGLITARLTDDDDSSSDAAAGEQAELTRAESVPDVALERFDGSELKLSEYDQPLVVNFWGSWCEPCVDEMPDLQEVHESLGEDIAFLGVNVRDDVEAAEAMAERTGVTYDLARDVSGDLGRELGITTFPTTVLVLPDGTVVDTLHGQVSAARLCEAINQSFGAGECG